MSHPFALMHTLYRLLTCSMLIGFIVVSTASADHVCSIEVSYGWEKKPQEPAEDSGEEKVMKGEKGESKKVLWKKVSVQAKEEATAKQRVTDKAKEELAAADLQCTKLHEDLAGCMAAKFHASRSVLQTLSFKARKELEDAIVQGCKGQEGVCHNAKLSEVKCREKAEEQAPDENGEGAEDGDKEEG